MKQLTNLLKDPICTKPVSLPFPVYHHKKLFLLSMGLVLCTCFLKAQNPLITHMYTADPTAMVFDGKLYIYPSSDTVPPADYTRYQHCMPGYNIFSLENGATWKDHGRFLNNDEVPWALKGSYSMWAPDCIEKDGKYYFYFPVRAADSVHRVGVAIGSSPTGPFKVEKDYIPGTKGIDPGLLKDDDGTFYMYFWEWTRDPCGAFEEKHEGISAGTYLHSRPSRWIYGRRVPFQKGWYLLPDLRAYFQG